ncbi:hypothetical protein [Rubinisphaera sp.]|uniref:hypothetical protein n=1 Tax=Rubinisphaera sp. TaxID=2024857 RepID=UPI000C0D05CA|nr:hypothetical protein [Rubinisphaera sp.]MBV11472.1 hypothetical protein [Rubinisphaera sp.]|tara:strand:+ start:3600 stop:4727 length:1128 start_codon:yes stop_codon:yes gene_type:complete
MAHAYTPGLKVTECTNLRVRRILPISGSVHVEKGQDVQAEDVVAEAQIPGNIFPINLANLLATAPAELQNCMKKEVGDRVEIGDLLAESKGIFGFFKTQYHSKSAGVLEAVSKITGQVILRGAPIPVQVKAYVTGKVIDIMPEHGVVIESTVAFIQGIFGIGSEAYGPIAVACETPDEILRAEHIKPEMSGCVIIGGARMTNEAIAKAVEIGAAAVISGGIDDQDLKNILGYDLGVAITGTENIGPSLIITEGFGDIAMAERTHRLLCSHTGHAASVNGATQIRAGVMRPEIVIPLDQTHSSDTIDEGVVEGILEPGVTIRLIRDPYFGRIGQVATLPSEPQVLGSGSKARVLTVTCENGEEILVPRANVEIIAD